MIKRITALLIALLLLVGMVPSAFAEELPDSDIPGQETEAIQDEPIQEEPLPNENSIMALASTQNSIMLFDYADNGNYTTVLNSQVTCAYKPNGSGTTRTAYIKNMGWHFARYGGVAYADDPLYCIEPWRSYGASTSGNSVDRDVTLDGSGSTSGSNVWYALPEARREAIGLILLYSNQMWDHSVSVTTTKKDANPNVPPRVATQLLIFEIVCGLRDPDTFTRNSTNECGTAGDVFYNAGDIVLYNENRGHRPGQSENTIGGYVMLVETKARIGVFAIALGAYLPQFPSLVPEFEGQYEAFKKTLPDTVELIDGGLVTTKELSAAAGDKFRAADVDLVIVQLLTYATSYNMLPAVRDLDVPVVLVNLQKKKAPDYANTDTATWLGELYACGAVGEMVADLERAGKRHAVITGVVEGGDPVAQVEIEDWCKAAQVRRRFRDTNLAQIGRPYPGMMDLYIDETNLYHRMWLYTKQFDWEKMWAIADNITDEEAIHAKAEDILNTFDIESGATVETVWDMAKYVVAFEQWVKDEQIAFVASHYDGFAQGIAGKLDSMLIPAFSMLIKQGTACAVEGDIKVAMAMSILKTISGTGQLSEMYSIDFDKDICIIGHSGSGDADISQAKKPTMKIVPVFHGKTGGGYLTQFYPPVGPVTYLGITQDKDGHFKFVVAEGVNEEGPIFTFGDTNMRTRFTCGAREFCNRWSEAGPTHHMAAAVGRHIDTILKVAKIFNIPVDIVTR